MTANNDGVVSVDEFSELPKGGRITGALRTDLTQRLRDRYQAGASIRSLAQATGRSYGFIHTLLAEADVPLRGRGGPNRRPKPA